MLLESLELAGIYLPLLVGVYLSFRILDFPDLTVDASIVTGGATAALLILGGQPWWLGVLAAFLAGAVVGAVTVGLHLVLRIQHLLAGLLTMLGMYSVNLLLAGKPNMPLFDAVTVDSILRERYGYESTALPLVHVAFGLGVLALVYAFLTTDLGLALRACGRNEALLRQLGVSPSAMKFLGVGLANALAAVTGAALVQWQGFWDLNGGVGTIVLALASILLAEAIFVPIGIRPHGSAPQSLRERTLNLLYRAWGFPNSLRRAVSVLILGGFLYQFLLALALRIGIPTGALKLVSTVLVVFALGIPVVLARFARSPRSKRRPSVASKLAEALREKTATVYAPYALRADALEAPAAAEPVSPPEIGTATAEPPDVSGRHRERTRPPRTRQVAIGGSLALAAAVAGGIFYLASPSPKPDRISRVSPKDFDRPLQTDSASVLSEPIRPKTKVPFNAGRGIDLQDLRSAEVLVEDCSNGDGSACYALGTRKEKQGDLERATELYEESLRLFNTGCSERNGRACRWLATMYANGLGVEVNAKKAIASYEDGCSFDATLCTELGLLYSGKTLARGHVLPRHEKRAQQLFREACSRHNAPDWYSCQLTGALDRAIPLMEEACSEGNWYSCLSLGNKYLTQDNGELATSAFLRGCDSGSPEACQMLRTYTNLKIRSATIENKLSIRDMRSDEALTHDCSKGDGSACRALGRRREDQRDLVRAAELYEESCTLEHAPGCGEIGNAYRFGLGTRRDKSHANDLFSKACYDMNPPDWYSCYVFGPMTPLTHGAVPVMEDACSMGNSTSCLYLGDEYLTRNKPEQATSAYRRGCKNGMRRACQMLNTTDKTRVQRAIIEVEYLRDRCEHDNRVECALLGSRLFLGRYQTPRNHEAGARYLRKACNLESAIACNFLGDFYERGKWFAQDRQAAMSLFQKACSAVPYDARSCSTLGRIYLLGEGAAKDPKRAREYLGKACVAEDSTACFTLGTSYLNEGEDLARARKVLNQACIELNHAGACNNLGVMMEDGSGGPKNGERAISLFKKSCSVGDEKGCENYQRLTGSTDKVQPSAVGSN